MKAMWIAFACALAIAFIADFGLSFAGYSIQEQTVSDAVRLDN